MRLSGALRNLPYKNKMLVNELQKPYWEYSGAQLHGKTTQLQGPPKKRQNPRLAPHLGLISNIFRYWSCVKH